MLDELVHKVDAQGEELASVVRAPGRRGEIGTVDLQFVEPPDRVARTRDLLLVETEGGTKLLVGDGAIFRTQISETEGLGHAAGINVDTIVTSSPGLLHLDGLVILRGGGAEREKGGKQGRRERNAA